MDKFFKISERGSNVRTEIIAGLTTFFAMAYIVVTNPNQIVSFNHLAPDADPAFQQIWNAVYVASILAAIIGTLLMALYAKMPFAQACGMGLNSFFFVSFILPEIISGGDVIKGYHAGLVIILVSGFVFLLFSVTGLRVKVAKALPDCLKKAIPAGIGLFIAFIGLQNAGLSVDSSTLVTIISFPENFHTAGICALLALIGLFIMAVLYTYRVKGAILYGILGTWILGMLCQVTGIYTPDVENGFYTLFPTLGITDFSKLGETFGKCFTVDFDAVGIINFIVVIFSFLFVDIFDTLGTLIGVATKADMLDEEGRLPGIRPALMADAIATSFGAVLGTSTTTTFVESASGVAVGGRTGLTALVSALLFLLSTLFAPIFTAIPSFATAPALIMVGFLMVGTVTEIRFDEDNITEAIPAYLAIIAMPLFYSISEGISMGIISYVLLNVAAGKAKKITPLMYVLAVLFVLKYIFL